MALTRQTINPSPSLISAITRNQLRSMIPLSFQWFDKSALETDHALGQMLEALTQTVSPWLVEASKSKHASSLDTATGQYLDAIGASFGVARLFGELDDPYALRIQQTLLIERITAPAIVAALQQIVPFAEVFEPWRKLAIPSENWVLSGDTRLGSPDYWNAAVFEAQIHGQSGDVPGLDNFFQVMKAYGVKYWLAVFLPDQFIDYNNDPLSPLVAVPTIPGIPAGIFQDPTSISRPNSVIGSTLELITDIIPGSAEVGILSASEAIPSWSFMPSGTWVDDLYFTLDMVTDYYAPTTTALYAMDVLPIAVLDPNSPNYATIVANSYQVPSYDPLDLLNNVLIDEDVDASATAGYTILTLSQPEFDVSTTMSDLQGPCIIDQLP